MDVINLLSGETLDLLTSIGDWTLVGALPHTLSATQEKVLVHHTTPHEHAEFGIGFGSLKMVAGSTSPIHVETTSVSVMNQTGWGSRAFAWIYSEDAITATTCVTVYSPSASSASSTTEIPAGRWTLVSVHGGLTSVGGEIQMGVSLSGLAVGRYAYLSHPVLSTPDAISRNVFAAESWARLPEFLREVDEVQAEPSYPLLRFMDVLTTHANEILVYWANSQYIPPEEGGDAVAESLLEPELADIATLRWWAQILGIKFYDPSTGSTPWIAFYRALDPDLEPEWSDWLTGVDTNLDLDLTWSEIQNFDPLVSGLLELLRWQVRTAYYGLRAGTKTAIVECVKKGLTGTKSTVFISHADGDPWKFKVQTLTAETGSVPIADIVANAIPAGFEFVHEVV